MLTQLRQWLNTIPLSNPIERRQALIFELFLIGLLVVSIGECVFSLISGAPLITTLIIGLTGGVMGGALVLLRRGHFKRAVGLTTSLLLFSLALYSVPAGMNGVVFLVFVVPLTLAGLLIGRRGLVYAAGVSILIAASINFLQQRAPSLVGFAPDADANRSLITFILIIGLLSLFLDQFGAVLREALAAAHTREQDLERLRAALEATVAERTNDLQAALAEVQGQADAQARLLAEIEQQRTSIRELSVPVLPVSATTLVMPLVGVMDSNRLQVLQEQALHAVERTAARRLVLDITGVPVVDVQVAQGLIQVVQAVRLLGATVTLVGIRPEVAQALVGLGEDLQGMDTQSDLQSALDSTTRHWADRDATQTTRPPTARPPR
jgi:rsbT co-antagonist protein RsbR